MHLSDTYNLARDLPTSIFMHNKWKDSSHKCSVKKDVAMGLYTLTFTFMLSSLPCLHTFWHAIPTYCYISTKKIPLVNK